MTPQSFARKRLRFTFTLPTSVAVFPGTRSNVLTIEGLRASVTAEAQGQMYGQATARIFGMAQADMNALSFFTFSPRNVGNGRATMRIETNDGTGWFRLFEGQLIEAGPDYSAAPDVALVVLARPLYFEALQSTPPRSYPGTVSVASIVQEIAVEVGYAFENVGVTSTVTDAYLPGTVTDQLTKVCNDAQPQITWCVDSSTNTIAIAPGQAPRGGTIFVVSAQTGMVGYPTYNNVGPTVEVLYNPAIRILAAIRIESDFTFANGTWTVYQITSELSSETPGGPWFSTLACARNVVGGVPNAT